MLKIIKLNSGYSAIPQMTIVSSQKAALASNSKAKITNTAIPFELAHPRYPKNAANGKGGEFMPKGSADYKTAVGTNLLTAVKQGKLKLQEAQAAAKQLGITNGRKEEKMKQFLGRHTYDQLEAKIKAHGEKQGRGQEEIAKAIAKAKTLKGKPTTPQQIMLRDKALKDWTKEFEKWDASGQKKQWIRTSDTDSDGYHLIDAYIRKGNYNVGGKMQNAIQLANIQASDAVKGQGVFTSIIQHIEKKHPDKPLVLEEVNENSIALAKKNGFTPDPFNESNWIKQPVK